MKYFFLLSSFLSLLFFSCSVKKKQPDETVNLKIEIMEADRAFSAMSESKGLRNAFLEFIDSNGVLLRPGNLPLTGGNAMDFISQSNDTAFTMTWEPRSASIAASGELGYSYGVYSIKSSDADTVFYGTYVTVWKRQPNGKWKFVLQSANDGIE
jgi:ketosteroid isomerase-like protein